MHELGVVFYVVKDVKAVAEQNNVDHIDSVTLEIGEVSAVIPEQLIDCWEWAKKREPITQNAELKIEILEAINASEIVPQTERYKRQLQAALT